MHFSAPSSLVKTILGANLFETKQGSFQGVRPIRTHAPRGGNPAPGSCSGGWATPSTPDKKPLRISIRNRRRPETRSEELRLLTLSGDLGPRSSRAGRAAVEAQNRFGKCWTKTCVRRRPSPLRTFCFDLPPCRSRSRFPPLLSDVPCALCQEHIAGCCAEYHDANAQIARSR